MNDRRPAPTLVVDSVPLASTRHGNTRFLGQRSTGNVGGKNEIKESHNITAIRRRPENVCKAA